MHLPRVTGREGRVWVVDEREEVTIQRRAKCFHGWEEGREADLVFVQRVSHGDLFDDDREHVSRAVRLAQIPTMAGSPFILRALDSGGCWDSYFIFELADVALDRLLASDDWDGAETDAIIEAVEQALFSTHTAGYVHCDVQPANVFRVAGNWKLGDFGGAVRVGERVDTMPKDARFAAPGMAFGMPASPDMDTYAVQALRAVLNERPESCSV